MLTHMQRALAAFPVVLIWAAGAASAASGPLGTWIDHTGRGAVEISECNGALCGRVVWLKEAKDEDGCNLQIIGNAKPVAGGKWNGGWIWDPERQSKYDVELTPIGDRKLRVHGYAGMKLFGETMTWTRAPADLPRCGKSDAIQAEVARPVEPQTQVSPPEQKTEQIPSPQQNADQMPSNATAAAPQRETNRRAETPPVRDALGSLLQFSDRRTSTKQKMCTVKLMDFGKLSFPC